MRLLLDTHVAISLLDKRWSSSPARIMSVLSDPASLLFVSVASIWEIAIKYRLGKLTPSTPPARIPEALNLLGVSVLPIESAHTVADVDPEPATRDPFDRLLLAQCVVEQLLLVTIDRALAGHRLAWQPG